MEDEDFDGPRPTIPDVRVEIKPRNNLLLLRMEKAGIATNTELFKRMKDAGLRPASEGSIGKFINMQRPAKLKNGEWVPLALEFAKFFRCLPEELFSEAQQKQYLTPGTLLFAHVSTRELWRLE